MTRPANALFVSQFCTSAAALGILPFQSEILRHIIGGRPSFWLSGVLFHIPAFAGALSSPFWGRLADQHGQKKLLLRAQLGLALGFLFAALAQNAWQFFLALIFQGFIGGTYSATRAYLASHLPKSKIAQNLNILEGIVKLAWLAGPWCIGIVLEQLTERGQSPVEMYCILACFVALPVILVSKINWPTNSVQTESPKLVFRARTDVSSRQSVSFIATQLAFAGGCAAVAPFFVQFVTQQNLILIPKNAGLAFGIPHMVYLIAALFWISDRRPLSGPRNKDSAKTLRVGFSLGAAAMAGQGFSHSAITFVIWRLLLGLAMVLILLGSNELASVLSSTRSSGAWFGRLDGWTRVSGLAGGVVGAAGFSLFPSGPFIIAGAFFLAGALLTYRISEIDGGSYESRVVRVSVRSG